MQRGLISTAGVHLRSQESFSVYVDQGDWSWRPIPGDIASGDLTVTHTHYDTRDALRDVNVVFPIDRLRDLAAAGEVGGVSALHAGFMGFIPNPVHLVEETAPIATAELSRAGADAAVLTAP